jgi:hypothetical protein
LLDTPNIKTKSTSESMERLLQVRDLWNKSQKDRLEIGRLLYEERQERLAVGGSHAWDGFHEWLRKTGIPKTSSYRRIAAYEVSIGVRSQDDDAYRTPDPVPSGTTITDTVNFPPAQAELQPELQAERPAAPMVPKPTKKPLSEEDEEQMREAEAVSGMVGLPKPLQA